MPTVRIRRANLFLQPRDLSILHTLFESRVFTIAHAASLLFNGRKEAAKKRLQILKRAGLIVERPRAPSEPAVLHLSRKGLDVLQDNGVLKDHPDLDLPVLLRRAKVGNSTVRHELEVMDAKVAFHEAVRTQHNLAIQEFTTWPLLHSFTVSHPKGKGAKVLVLPDGYFEIRESAFGPRPKIHRFFLEVDRSTESLETLVSRSASYLAHYRSGGFAKSQGGDRSTFRAFPFRVLIVVSSPRRRENLLKALNAAPQPIYSITWIATREDLLKNTLGPIWRLPSESASSAARSTHALTP